MKSFDELTQRGKARRLRALAHRVLVDEYGLADPSIRLVSIHSFNTIFRVDTTDGDRFALRVGDAVRIHNTGVETTEAVWLNELNGAGIATPRNVPTASGACWTTANSPAVTGERVFTLFTWIDGRELPAAPLPAVMVEVGRLQAELHELALQSLVPIPDRLRLIEAIYLGPTNLISTYESEHGSLLIDAVERVQQLIDRLWTDTATGHLIHGDYGPGNLLVRRNQLRVIDFQDLGFGFDVLDMAITLTDLARGAPELIPSLLEGYRQVRPLPDLPPDRLAALSAWRSLNIVNLALLAPASGIGRVLERHVEYVVSWMEANDRSSAQRPRTTADGRSSQEPTRSAD